MTESTINTHGARQLEILDIIWRADEPMTVSAVVGALNETRKPKDRLAYTTVLTMLRNLEKRKTLARQKDGRHHYYWPNISSHDFKAKYCQWLLRHVFRDNKAEMKHYMKAMSR